MKSLDSGRLAFGICAATLMVAACSAGSTPPTPSYAAPTAERTRSTAAYSVLYSFKGGSRDGENPYAGLISVGDTLYGATANGGKNGTGTVFAITEADKETVFHKFGGSGDGANPFGGLLDINGTLYGTTFDGGTSKFGTAFAIAASGKETVLHSFGDADGAWPEAGLINVAGTLYGTTADGGTNGVGTVFAITKTGTETVLHNFEGGSGDGDVPYAGLLDVKGTLYGTTVIGGASCGSYHITGCGVVFSITPSGTETVLHSFGTNGDGTYPYAGLVNVKGTLYGTDEAGGANCTPFGCGTIFSITRSGNETVLHNLGGKGDGAYPGAALLDVNGTLYGTTVDGGANGDGTVFSLKP